MKFEYTVDPKCLKASPEVEAEFDSKLENHASLFENILKAMVPSGIPSAKGRAITRILNKLDLASNAGYEVIDLDVSEVSLLVDVFIKTETNVPAGLLRPYSLYCDKLEEISK